ncbi:MAG: ankyrin repeat domain-containing protein [Verrucomicrobiota bacterium]
MARVLPLFFLTCSLFLAACEKKEPPPAAPSQETSLPRPPDRPPFHQELFLEAALNGNLAVIEEGLRRGNQLEAEGEGQRTVLMQASFNGHSEVVRLLLKAGANVAHRDAARRTSLMYACTGDNMDTIRLLLRHGAEVNAVDGEEQFSPLMYAAAEGLASVVSLLLEKGADPEHRDRDGDTAADFARRAGHLAVAKLIEEAAG